MAKHRSRLKWIVLAGAALVLLAGCSGKGGYTVSGNDADEEDSDDTVSIGARGTPAPGFLAPVAGLAIALLLARRQGG